MSEKETMSVSGDNPWHAINNAAHGLRRCELQPYLSAGKHWYRITVERVEPQWWHWDSEEWEAAVDPGADWRGPFVQLNLAGRYICTVCGTLEDRDEKRDALIEAARKAGKP